MSDARSRVPRLCQPCGVEAALSTADTAVAPAWLAASHDAVRAHARGSELRVSHSAVSSFRRALCSAAAAALVVMPNAAAIS